VIGSVLGPTNIAGLCLALAALAFAFALAPTQAHAQAPTRLSLRIVVPLAAGSTTDSVARLVGEALDGNGSSVVVDNRPGAGGRVAMEAFRRADPSGRTLLVAPIAVPVIAPLVVKDLAYDPARDLVPVAQLTTYSLAFAVAANNPARTVPEFVAWVKARPAGASFGTQGAGSLPHFLGATLARAAGIELTHVAYKGIAQLDADLLGGEVAAGISAINDFVPFHRAGRMRILATSGVRRSPLLEDIPNFREQGYPAVEAEGWHAVFAPAGTPQTVIDQLSAAIGAAVRMPSVRAKLVALGLEPTGTTPQALAAIMAADTARWRAIIKASGFSVE
jgi:tripartite-type tricarboxylate transporter receptor subunit TctC